MKKILFIFSCFALIFFWGHRVSAASFNLLLANDVAAVGDKVGADIRIDSEGVGINAAQATLQFPKDILQVDSVSKDASLFSFWLQDPTIDNNAGSVSFIGGSISGFSGKSLQILHVVFIVKSVGSATVSFTDAAIAANDGNGTNVLSSVNGGIIQTTAKTTTLTAAPAPGTPTIVPPVSQIIPPPTQIVRTPAAASGLPAKPSIKVSLYPDSQSWNNVSAPFTVKWDLPGDITDVATALTKSVVADPVKSEGLFDNKVFPALSDGVWYVHVRFKNKIGWGATAHYRLAVDTTPPPSFTVTVKEGSPTDNPSPSVSYKAGDQLSGVLTYLIKLDSDDTIETKQTFYVLSLLAPGIHNLLIGARDAAGNVTEDLTKLEILPIAAPVISSSPKSLYANEGGLNANGDALPDITILLTLKSDAGSIMYNAAVSSTAAGKWVANIDSPVKKGRYFLEIKAQDARGALSLPVKSEEIVVRDRPFFMIYGLEVSQLGFFLSIIMLMLIGFGVGWYTRHLAKQQTGRKVLIAERDVINVYGQIKKEVDKVLEILSDMHHLPSADKMTEMKYHLESAESSLTKLNKYAVDNIKDLR
jgi:hypothetical protein